MKRRLDLDGWPSPTTPSSGPSTTASPTARSNLLTGKPKAGKSTLARYLTFCLATGTPWLGYRTRAGAVWYLALEDKQSEVKRHFRELGATGSEPIRFLFGDSPNRRASFQEINAVSLSRHNCKH